VNDSPSTISPSWPTRWPKDSFTGPWTWLLAIVVAAMFAGSFAVGVLKGGSISYASITPLELYLSIGLSAVVEGAFVVVALLALPALSKFSLRELGFRTPTLATLGGAALGALAMVVVANGLASLIDSLAHVNHQQDVVEIFRNLHDPVAVAVFAFFAIVFAPIAEETLFRIFFFNLGMRYGGFWAGAILSGALFGMAHGDLYAAVPLALGGMVLCFVYYRTRNAWASMMSHCLFNALSILALLFAPSWLTN
jgi:membrane protease YdiL (CAAX protease family)